MVCVFGGGAEIQKFLLWDFASDFIGLDDGNDEAFENVVQI